MSSPKIHLIQSLASSALLYPVIGENALPFGLAIVFIDLDHVLEYVANTKDFSPEGFFVFHKILVKNLNKDYLALALFHTLECYLLIFLLAHWFPVCYYVLFGFLFHHAVDQIFLIRMKQPFKRAFSIIEYYFRKKNHVTSLNEFLQQGNINVKDIPDLSRWLVKWGITVEPERLNHITTEASRT